jgi:hypothetical protein
MKIKHDNGMVTFLMRTGKTFVRHKMPVISAQYIINRGKDVIEKDGQIIVDDTYFFPAVIINNKKQRGKSK